jgi:hypothetical protein
MGPMWRNTFELSNENILDQKKELNDLDHDFFDVKPVKHLSAKQFLSTLTLPLASYMIITATGREVPKLLER